MAKSFKSNVPGLVYKIVKIPGEKAHYFSIFHEPSGALVWEMPERTKNISDVVALSNKILARGDWDQPVNKLDLAGSLHEIMRDLRTAIWEI